MKRCVAFLLSAVLSAALCVSAAALGPVTGDTSNIPLMIALLVGAAILVVVVIIVLVKKGKK